MKHTGLMFLTFYEECRVEGKPALLMKDLFIDEKVYVSPNSIMHGYIDNKSEAYLLQNKLNDILNMDSLLMQMRDIVNCTNGNGIGLDMDMISFGVQRGKSVSYKLVDIDVMVHDGNNRYQLRESNTITVKEDICRFVKYFIETNVARQKVNHRLRISIGEKK